MKKIVVALGGNAILKKGQKPSAEVQSDNIKDMLKKVFFIMKENKIVITHGNGPQVGYLLLQQQRSKKNLSQMPLDVIDAETEGQIGYLIQQNLKNLFSKRGANRKIVTLLTQVIVSKLDVAFKKPSKFVGPFYTKKEAEKLKRKFAIKKDIGRGWRRVVASPKPIKIIEAETIEKLVDQNVIVIAAGGGGIPVVKKNNKLEGVEAVIDKDLASACLGRSIDAEILLMITDIDGAYLNFETKNQKLIKKVKLKEIKKYYKEGHFPKGNMGPKIEAAIEFLSGNGKKVIITDANNVEKAIKGTAGTIIIK